MEQLTSSSIMLSVKNEISTAPPCAANSRKAQSKRIAVSNRVSSTSERGGKGSRGGDVEGGAGRAPGRRGGILSGGK